MTDTTKQGSKLTARRGVDKERHTRLLHENKVVSIVHSVNLLTFTFEYNNTEEYKTKPNYQSWWLETKPKPAEAHQTSHCARRCSPPYRSP